ncbi:MAG: toprim domain-containing protein [Gemmatimonadaceae bacterium]|nr:toprim domain-containing protein [Gemmatimonadaceae bacterium]
MGACAGPGEPKYLNSSDSPIFSKGQLLYGLQWARNSLRKDDQALVVEGYMDVIRCHLAGATQAVAGLGTALTEGQAQLLTRYTKNVFLLYDSDEAGQKATFKAGKELLRQQAAVRFVNCDTYPTATTRTRSSSSTVVPHSIGRCMRPPTSSSARSSCSISAATSGT